jgi:hypothetical protein
MRQTTRAEVRLDHGKAAGSGITRRAIRWFGYEQGRSQSNFVAAKPAGTEDQVQRDRNPGNVGINDVLTSPAHSQNFTTTLPPTDPFSGLGTENFCLIISVQNVAEVITGISVWQPAS